jgi:hypothetical protein
MDIIDPSIITIERLTQLAANGHLSKDTLTQLLAPEQRKAYEDACGEIEKTYTHECQASGDPCLESGCSICEGEVCLQPLMHAGVEYQKKCAAEWTRFFANPQNRIDAWKH